MKIDSTDAQIAYLQPSAQSPQTSTAPSQSSQPVRVEEPSLLVQVNKVEGAEKGDSGNSLSDKHISELTPIDKEKLTISEKTIIEAIEKANRAALGRNTSFRFSVHEATKRISIKVLDSDTNEVIREIPPEKVLDMVAKMWEMSGLFVDEKR